MKRKEHLEITFLLPDFKLYWMIQARCVRNLCCCLYSLYFLCLLQFCSKKIQEIFLLVKNRLDQRGKKSKKGRKKKFDQTTGRLNLIIIIDLAGEIEYKTLQNSKNVFKKQKGKRKQNRKESYNDFFKLFKPQFVFMR